MGTMIKEVNFSKFEQQKIRTIGYKSDGNTVAKHFYMAYPVNEVLEDDSYKGLWMVEHKYQYSTDYEIFNDCGDNVFVGYCVESEYNDISALKKTIDTYFIDCIGRDGYIRFLNNKENKHQFIGKAYITVLVMIGEEELAKHYIAYRNNLIQEREEKEKARKEEAIRKEKEEEEKQKAELESKLLAAEEKFKNYQEVENDDGIILELMRKHNIKVPLRTQGWILDSLYSVYFDEDKNINYRFYKTNRNGKRSNGSQAVFDCLRELKNILCDADNSDNSESIDLFNFKGYTQ